MVCQCRFGCRAEGKNKRGCACTCGQSHACLGLQRIAQAAVEAVEKETKEESGGNSVTVTVTLTVKTTKENKGKDDEEADDEEEKDWKVVDVPAAVVGRFRPALEP